MNQKLKSALRAFQIIEKAADACRLRIEVSAETDPAHQMLEGIVQACREQIQSLKHGTELAALAPAMAAVLSRHPEATHASVSFFATTTTTQSKTGIPAHQPLQEQCEWAVRKRATQITLTIKLHDGTSIIESFPARQLVGPNFLV